MPTQLAAQLYTLREFTKTPLDIARTLARVRKMGYEAVQCSGMGKIEPEELKKILDGEGLTCCATHAPLARMLENPRQVIDDNLLWSCQYTAIGGYFPTEPSAEDWSRFTSEFSGLAQKFLNSGVQLGYHNHSHELTRFGPKTVLQNLFEAFPPSVWFEIDTYWITAGGGDPVEWITKAKGRGPCIHLKDMAVTPKREQRMAEIGQGNLNWPAILSACRAAGVEWYIIEQDDCYDQDPFDCLQTSLRNLHQMGLG